MGHLEGNFTPVLYIQDARFLKVKGAVPSFIVNISYGPTWQNRLVVHTDTVCNIRGCHSRFNRAATMRSPYPFLGVNKPATFQRHSVWYATGLTVRGPYPSRGKRAPGPTQPRIRRLQRDFAGGKVPWRVYFDHSSVYTAEV